MNLFNIIVQYIELKNRFSKAIFKGGIFLNELSILFTYFFISLPENVFMVIMTFIFLNRFDLLDLSFKKQSILRVLIPSVPVSVGTCILFITKNENPILSMILIVLMISLLINTCDKEFVKKNFNYYFSIIRAFLFSFIIFSIIQTISIIIILSITQKSIGFYNSSILLNFLITIPSLILETIIISLVIASDRKSVV